MGKNTIWKEKYYMKLKMVIVINSKNIEMNANDNFFSKENI